MNKRLSKRRRLLLICLAIIALSGTFLVLLPRLLQLPLVQEKIYAAVTRQFPGEVTYREEALTLFPRPCIHFHDAKLSTGPQFSAAIDELSATFSFLPLLGGRFNISKLTLAGVMCTAEVPEPDRDLSPAMVLAAIERPLETWTNMLGPVKQERFALDVEDCDLRLTRAGNPFFRVRNIDGGLSWLHPVISLEMTSESDLWNPSRLMLEMNVGTREISGRLRANRLKTTPGVDFLFAGTPIRLEEAALDADISLETDSFETWRLSIEAFNPDVAFSNGETRLSLRGKKAAGDVRIDDTGIHASISDLDLDTPGLRLSGEFDLDTRTPSAGWQVNVDSLDIASARAPALFFAGRFKTARVITQVFRDGGIERLALGQEAETLDGLRKVSTFHLRGRLDGATVFVPKAELLLTESFGNVTVSGGEVKASDIETRLGNSTGSRGSFTMALAGKKPRPWSVGGDIRGDLAELPPLLERLTRNTALAREMAGIESAEGSAEGTLALDRSVDALEITVDVSNFDLSAVYHRIPFPVTLSGSGFFYRGRELRVEGVRGSIGASRVFDLDAEITWQAAPHLDISSARAEVDAEELAEWLGTRFPDFRNMNGPAPCTGRFSIDRLRFDGPVDNPKAWQFQTDGSVTERLTIRPPLFSETIAVDSGKFSATHEKIEVEDARMLVLDTPLSASGSLAGYLAEGPREVDVIAVGRLGQTISDWMMEHAGIPKALQWRTPVNAIPITLHWQENGHLDITGDAAFETGLRLSFDLSRTDNAFTSGRFDFRHEGRRATAILTRQDGGLGLRYTGDLSQGAVSSFLVDNRLLTGTLSGDFNARWDLKPPYLKNMTGHLQLGDIDLTPAGLPLKIEQATLTGQGTATDIAFARFEWKRIGFSASGRANRTDAGLVLDLELATERLDWADIKSLAGGSAAPEAAAPPFLLGEIRLTCGTLSLTPALTFTPFEAQLKLDGKRTDIVFQQADACGISFPGTLSLTPTHIGFDFNPSATQQDLEPTAGCLKKGTAFMDGRFDLTGHMAFEWDRSGSLTEAIEGSASLTAVDGRIYKGGTLGKLFSMLNVTELLSGQFPDFEEEGFRYKTSTFAGKFKAGTFELETGVIDSPAMKLFFEGTEDVMNRQHDLTIVVAPLKTVDAVVDKIPVLNDVLEKGLVIYPVRVTGDWEEPQLYLLSPTAVGGEVLGIMLRTLKAPVTLLEKIFHETEKAPKKNSPPSRKGGN